MKTKVIFLTFLTLLVHLYPLQAQAQAQIYISQIQITGGEGKTREDFIELFNPNDAPFNLKGFRLVKRTEKGASDTSIKSWTDDVWVPAKSFYLWANSTFTSITITPDIKTTATISDDNGIAIRQGPEDTGAIIDSASWGKAENGFRKVLADNPIANQALVRSGLESDGSPFVIAVSKPRNSSQSLTVSPPPPPPAAPEPAPAPQTQPPAVQPSQSTATTSGTSTLAQNSQPAVAAPSSQTSQNQTQTQKQDPQVSQPADQNPAPAQGLVLGNQTASSQPVVNLPQAGKQPENKLAVNGGEKMAKTTKVESIEPKPEEKLMQREVVGDQNFQTADASKAQETAKPDRKPLGYLALAGFAFLLFCALIYWNIFRKTPDKKGEMRIVDKVDKAIEKLD